MMNSAPNYRFVRNFGLSESLMGIKRLTKIQHVFSVQAVSCWAKSTTFFEPTALPFGTFSVMFLAAELWLLLRLFLHHYMNVTLPMGVPEETPIICSDQIFNLLKTVFPDFKSTSKVADGTDFRILNGVSLEDFLVTYKHSVYLMGTDSSTAH